MSTKKKVKFVLAALSLPMILATAFSWWQTKIEMQLTGSAFWEHFLKMEAVFAVAICIVGVILFLAGYVSSALSEQ
jgi:hypothetical protein